MENEENSNVDDDDSGKGIYENDDISQNEGEWDNDKEKNKGNPATYAPGVIWCKYRKNYYPNKEITIVSSPERGKMDSSECANQRA